MYGVYPDVIGHNFLIIIWIDFPHKNKNSSSYNYTSRSISNAFSSNTVHTQVKFHAGVIEFLSVEFLVVSCTLQKFEGYCGSYTSMEYRVYCTPVFVNEECIVPFTSDSLKEKNLKLTFSATETDLLPNCIYMTTIETIRNNERINSTGNIYIST